VQIEAHSKIVSFSVFTHNHIGTFDRSCQLNLHWRKPSMHNFRVAWMWQTCKCQTFLDWLRKKLDTLEKNCVSLQKIFNFWDWQTAMFSVWLKLWRLWQLIIG